MQCPQNTTTYWIWKTSTMESSNNQGDKPGENREAILTKMLSHDTEHKITGQIRAQP
jgi:hypothetical protein